MKKLALALAALALVACQKPKFDAVTSAPPGSVAEYHEQDDDRWIDVTEGVAFGVSCEDVRSTPCSYDGTFVADAAIAAVYRGYSELSDPAKYYADPNSRASKTVIVVVGLAVGTTVMRVRTGRGDYAVRINVKPAPPRA